MHARELGAPADERDVEAGCGREDADQAERVHCVGLSFQRQRLARLGADGATAQTMRRLAEQNLAGRGRLLEPRRDVHGVARDERVARRRDDVAAVDADPHVEPEPLDAGAEVDCRPNGPQGVVLVQLRNAEDGHDGVADELLDRSAVALERPSRRIEVALLQQSNGLGVETFRPARVAHHVAEEDGDDLAYLRVLGHVAASATARSVSASRVETSIVVAPDSRHAASRSAIRSRGPTSAISSTSASGTAAAASRCFPSR
jgi:hypothetical protein